MPLGREDLREPRQAEVRVERRRRDAALGHLDLVPQGGRRAREVVDMYLRAQSSSYTTNCLRIHDHET